MKMVFWVVVDPLWLAAHLTGRGQSDFPTAVHLPGKDGVSMKSIHCWDDLARYGVVPLTGEACGLSYRLLCDVTAHGKEDARKSPGRCPTGSPRKLEPGFCG